ncbi:tyrosine-type recombinase/integrase [Aquibacillus salsiterrae]|uniref:Tyrosine-type recombinase/integrase n=1 Tax=Aquibacillus salsiterrae TaxID=2950439 RepID=A0A9X3WFS2_9BACI|nr:tyrosine-type recombinase/integrase [Aquibacillus salsiterrae]MDC3416221.1 tyrosine-type recombinase/integrase [Aquibacillus salsiterrae]MDC3416313.1 tyrosine-type recombinase/integrase [Aquibacillus salsiterrae]
MMTRTAYRPSVTTEKMAIIRGQLQGYLDNDVWDVTDPLFEKYGGGDSWTGLLKRITFSSLPVSIRDEVKFFFANQLVNESLSLSTMLNYSSSLGQLNLFLEKYYPRIESLVDIPYTQGLMKYKTTLTNTGIRITNKDGYNTAPITTFNSIFKFLSHFYDTRDEVEKDVWDLRKIPNARYTINKTSYLISFEKIPPLFRQIVKDYCMFALTYLSQGKLAEQLRGISCYIDFIYKNYPDWKDFNQLKRQDVEKYFIYFNKKNASLSASYKYKLLSSVKNFLEYLQRSERSESPLKFISTLFFKEDFPKISKQNENQIKYIPETVMNQLELLIKLNPLEITPPMDDNEKEYIPIVMLLMATGWRISDILNLRFQNCLITTNKGYYLQGDIPKTDVKNHRVPIDREIAKIIQFIIKQTEDKSTKENNPEGYLFVRTKGKRRGKPFTGASIQNALNRWATRYNIVDQNGETYHFGNHAFRHTKGVELINLGMNLTHIMKWFAHASPEMTLMYAKIADDTLRKEWEKAQEKKGPLLRVDLGDARVSEMNLDDDLIHWEYIRSNIEAVRVPLGYCLASKKEGCPYVVTPCLTCPNFCTTPENLPDFEREIEKIEEHIEMTKQYPIYNEKTKEQLTNLTKIRDQLNEGKMHRGDSARKTLLQAQKGKESVVI